MPRHYSSCTSVLLACTSSLKYSRSRSLSFSRHTHTHNLSSSATAVSKLAVRYHSGHLRIGCPSNLKKNWERFSDDCDLDLDSEPRDRTHLPVARVTGDEKRKKAVKAHGHRSRTRRDGTRTRDTDQSIAIRAWRTSVPFGRS